MLTKGPTPDPKRKWDISLFPALPHLLDSPGCGCGRGQGVGYYIFHLVLLSFVLCSFF